MTDLPGFNGRLVTPSFLVRCVSDRELDADLHARWKATADAHAAARVAIGPASSVRTLLDVAVAPLLAALGFDAISDVAVDRMTIAGTARASDRSVAFLVIPWGERFESHWRHAVVEARDRAAPWCLLFNGTHLRVADPAQLYSRRYIECDLGVAVGRAHTIAALTRIAGA